MSSTSSKIKPKATNTSKLSIRILRITECPNLSANSNITYHIGVNDDDQSVYIRIYENSGGGFFCQSWIKWSDIEQIIKSHESVSSHWFQDLFTGKSINSPAFLAAALLDAGLIKRFEAFPRRFVLGDVDSVIANVQKLIDSDTNLKIKTPTKQITAKRSASNSKK